MKDVIIIGSGPAGISAALYTARAGLDTTVLSLGNSALDKAELIQNYYGFATPITGSKLAQDAIEGAKIVGVDFINEEVIGISDQGNFLIETTQSTYETKNVVLATGSPRLTPKNLKIDKFEGKGVSYCAVCDAFFYRGKDVAVLGTGEYAIHEAETLLPIANSVILLTNGEELTVNISSEITVIAKKIKSIEGGTRLEKILFENETAVAIDGLFIAYGVAGSTALARKIGAETEGNKIMVSENMATNVPGLYAAGDCTGGLLQISKAVYEGTKAGVEIIKQTKKGDTNV